MQRHTDIAIVAVGVTLSCVVAISVEDTCPVEHAWNSTLAPAHEQEVVDPAAVAGVE